MADLRMPDINSVIIVGNLIKDPIFRNTNAGVPVANFTIASTIIETCRVFNGLGVLCG